MKVHRLLDNPIITPHMDARMGSNINGPSLIKVPDWVTNPLGKYYLYFGHHRGDYIRLAYADEITGPWQIHTPGVMPLADSGFSHHLASPEIRIDKAAQQIRLYYHGGDELKHQFTSIAISSDGLHFKRQHERLMPPYARLFDWQNWVYAITMPGQFYRSRDGLNQWEKGPLLYTADMRHTAVRVAGDRLQIVHSNRGDCPESLLYSEIDLQPDWFEWKESKPKVLLKPERDYEGGNLIPKPSVIGPIDKPACQLRDPAFYEENGSLFMLYSVAGECGLALAELSDF